jgi:hypothetical protein
VSPPPRSTIAYVDWGLGLYEAQIGNIQEALCILGRSLKLFDALASKGGDGSQRVEVAADYAFVLYVYCRYSIQTMPSCCT